MHGGRVANKSIRETWTFIRVIRKRIAFFPDKTWEIANGPRSLSRDPQPRGKRSCVRIPWFTKRREFCVGWKVPVRRLRLAVDTDLAWCWCCHLAVDIVEKRRECSQYLIFNAEAASPTARWRERGVLTLLEDGLILEILCRELQKFEIFSCKFLRDLRRSVPIYLHCRAVPNSNPSEPKWKVPVTLTTLRTNASEDVWLLYLQERYSVNSTNKSSTVLPWSYKSEVLYSLS